MRAFVAGGGTLIMSAHSAVKNRDNTMTTETLPIMGMRELFGAEIDSFQTYQPTSKDKNALKFTDGTSLSVNVFADILKIMTAKIIAVWERDFLKDVPAVTENKMGKGKAVYYGAFFNDDSARYLIKRYAAEQKIQPFFTGFPAEIEVTKRTKDATDYYFILNHKNESVPLKIGAGFYDLLDQKNAALNFTLAPFGYKVLRKAQ